MSFDVYFSNRTEQLYEEFKRSYLATGPFTRRVVIVPSTAMKSWLSIKMASDAELGVSAGLEIGFLDPSLKKLSSLLLSKSVESSQEPDTMKLALGIETAIKECLAEYHTSTHQQKKVLEPLRHYLGIINSDQLSRRSQRRVTALSIELSKLFLNYGTYGGKVVAEWANSTPTHWQHVLWQKIESLFSPWLYPYRKLETFTIDQDWQPGQLQVYLFGLSYIAPLHHRWFQNLSHYLPVRYYLLSPCQQFWSDTLSEKEGSRLMAFWQSQGMPASQLDALDQFLRDTNPLLANFGKPGREMAAQIEMSRAHVHEDYVSNNKLAEHPVYTDLLSPDLIQQHDHTPLTMLEAVQADLLLMRKPGGQKVEFSQSDVTLQVHGAPKPAREVQVVYDTILSIIEKHQRDESPITPGDILVMAPDINVYSPFVRSVFESADSKLAAHLMDLKSISEHSLIQGFLELLQLPLGRWELSRLLDLMQYPSFKASRQISSEEIKTLADWLKKAGIRWGNDSSHRNELLKRDHGVAGMVEECWHGTWEHGLGRLLEGLAIRSEAQEHWLPLGGIDPTQSELLGKFLQLFRSLLLDLKPLVDNTQMTLGDWSNYLKCLFDTYFAYGHEDKNAAKLLNDHISAFAKAGQKQETAKFFFHTILRHLELAFEAQIASHKEAFLGAVRFCSLLPMRAVPAKVIILMGMNDGKFPRSNQSQTLNLLLDHAKIDYYPSQVEFDRYLFLESLLSARRYFIMTYTTQTAGDPHPQVPSLLVEEVLAYVDKAYTISGNAPSQLITYDHPLKPFHKTYFSHGSRLKSYSKHYYIAAQAHYGHQKDPPNNFLSAFTLLPDNVTQLQETRLQLGDLLSFAKNPFKVYFNKVLNIYVDKDEKRRIKNDEELLVARYHRKDLLKAALSTSSQAAFNSAEAQGQLPRGPFRNMELNRLHDEVETYQKILEEHGIDHQGLFSIEFNEHCRTPVLLGKQWHLPPLSISDNLIGSIDIVGKIDGVSCEGLVIFDKCEFEKTLEIWPELLVLCCLIKKHSLPIAKEVVFIKDKIGKKALDFACPEQLLIHFLNYYYKSKTNLSPMLPKWSEDIIKKNIDNIQKKIESDYDDTIYNEYLEWLIRSSPELDLAASLNHWHPIAESLFVDMKNAWFPGRTKGAANEQV